MARHIAVKVDDGFEKLEKIIRIFSKADEIDQFVTKIIVELTFLLLKFVFEFKFCVEGC